MKQAPLCPWQFSYLNEFVFVTWCTETSILLLFFSTKVDKVKDRTRRQDLYSQD